MREGCEFNQKRCELKNFLKNSYIIKNLGMLLAGVLFQISQVGALARILSIN
jgi:hypothetical protein